MASIIWQDAGGVTSLLGTELNGLADGARAITNAIDIGPDLLGDFELLVQYASSAPAAGATVAHLFCVPTIDGTNYAEGSTSVTPQAEHFVCSFESRAGSTSQFERLIALRRVLPARDAKFLLMNVSLRAFAASGNTLRARFTRYQSAA